MCESETIWLKEAKNTFAAGVSLAEGIGGLPLTMYLTGELGSGKTTFLQGFANGLGISEQLSSPTFALEQRYETPFQGTLLHLDLYRLKPAEARALVATTDDHPGIRCIEWAERLGDAPRRGSHINIELREDAGTPGRTLIVTYHNGSGSAHITRATA